MMKKRKEFNNILDECLERVLIEGEAIEQCLASYPELAAELEPLLQTALATSNASAIKPRPEFRDRARYQFRVALQEMEDKRGRRFFSWQPRWATAVIVVLVLLLAGGGTVTAAGNSMPDEPLYRVKLATEAVRLVLTPSTLGKAELYVNLADKRVVEIIKMAEKGKSEHVERTAQRLNTCLVRAVNLAAPQEEKAGALLTPAPEAAPREIPAPTEEKETGVVMAPAPPAVEEAPVAPERGRVGPGERIKLDRRAKLRVIVARNAVNHPAALRAMLERVPESAKPALRRAIAVSDTGYKKALRVLEERD